MTKITLTYSLLASLALTSSSLTAANSYVYTMTNASSSNQILIYDRAADGSLTYQSAVPTGGLGSGYQLGTQGSLITTGKYIFAANAGSNTISVLSGYANLTVLATYSSGGVLPVSLTYFRGTLYVLNAGSPPNITGFSFDENSGILAPIAGSTQSLSTASASATEVLFNNAGTALLVTEESTNLIDVFPVTAGVAGSRTSYPSHGKSPSGLVFGKNGIFYVTEAWLGTSKLSASASSYQLNSENVPQLISGSVPTGKQYTCCISINPVTNYLYASDYNTAFFTVLSATTKGVLSNGSYIYAGTGGAGLADTAVSSDGLNLYVLDHNAGNVFAFTLNTGGGVNKISGGSFVPASASGLIVR